MSTWSVVRDMEQARKPRGYHGTGKGRDPCGVLPAHLTRFSPLDMLVHRLKSWHLCSSGYIVRVDKLSKGAARAILHVITNPTQYLSADHTTAHTLATTPSRLFPRIIDTPVHSTIVVEQPQENLQVRPKSTTRVGFKPVPSSVE